MVLGDVTRLKTRAIYRAIDAVNFWDGTQKITDPAVISEFIFWKFKIVELNYCNLHEYEIRHIFAASDTSSTGLAAYLSHTTNIIAYKNLTNDEQLTSSTERELMAIQQGVHSFNPILPGGGADSTPPRGFRHCVQNWLGPKARAIVTFNNILYYTFSEIFGSSLSSEKKL